MLRSLNSIDAFNARLKARIRQLWEQCDLFEQAPSAQEWVRPEPSVAKPPRAEPPRQRATSTPKARAPRVSRTNPQDEKFVMRLAEAHAKYNSELFGGALHEVPIRISRRMKNRLGHYMMATQELPAEIAISRRHIRRDGWDEVLHTLVHEMVHQWQAENGLPLDHGKHFRRKAREIGISARATRPISASDH